jgi:hypothetical protein
LHEAVIHNCSDGSVHILAMFADESAGAILVRRSVFAALALGWQRKYLPGEQVVSHFLAFTKTRDRKRALLSLKGLPF